MTRREWWRRGVHVAVGLGAFLLPVVGWEVVAAAAALAVPGNAFLLPRVPLLRNCVREDGGGLPGLVLYPAVVLVLVVLFRDRLEVAQVAWLALAFGDGLAPVLGTRLRRPPWPWCPAKAVPASLAAFGIVVLVAWPATSLRLAVAGGLGGLLGETLPVPVDDNVLVPGLAAVAAVLSQGV